MVMDRRTGGQTLATIIIFITAVDLHLNLKFAGRSISFRPKSFEPVPSGTALFPLQAPYSPVMSRLKLQSSESDIAHQQSQLPTASFLVSSTGKKALKQCKTYRSCIAASLHFVLTQMRNGISHLSWRKHSSVGHRMNTLGIDRLPA